MKKWIFSEDEMPQDSVKVLALSDDEIIVAYRKNGCWNSFPGNFYAHNIKKWMSLCDFYE